MENIVFVRFWLESAKRFQHEPGPAFIESELRSLLHAIVSQSMPLGSPPDHQTPAPSTSENLDQMEFRVSTLYGERDAADTSSSASVAGSPTWLRYFVQPPSEALSDGGARDYALHCPFSWRYTVLQCSLIVF